MQFSCVTPTLHIASLGKSGALIRAMISNSMAWNEKERNMTRMKLLFNMLAVLVVYLACSTPAHAQATRTWVSGVGDDANPCSRTAPCKTFAGAISKTAAGGEINCLDPAGFGAVTITKSITIDCHHTEGGILAASVNGVI